MSYIGIIGAKRIVSSCPSLSILDYHDAAISLNNMGIDMHIIKRQTGWELGIEGKWRYEIDDPFHTTSEIEDHVKMHFGESINIRYCMKDTLLLTAYPAFERLRLYAMYHSTKRYSGYFDPYRYAMMVCMGTSFSPFDYQTEGILLHEIQHLIQEEEDFARGGDISMGQRRYRRMAGEVEARNICIRHSLSHEERLTKLRIDTQDVPDEIQIIKDGRSKMLGLRKQDIKDNKVVPDIG